MAQQTTIALTNDEWTLLTDSDVTSLTVQAQGADVWLKATTDTTAPTSMTGSILLPRNSMFVNEAMTDLFPGLTGADRVWGRTTGANGQALVSHG